MSKKNKILFIVGFPPPASGQLIMQKKMYDLIEDEEKRLISLNFSTDSKDFSKTSFKKVIKLILVVLKIARDGLFFQNKISKVYYSLSGPKKGALVKDIMIGFPLTLFFKRKLVLQVHAGGYNSIFVESKFLFKCLKVIYKNVEHLLCLTNYQKEELKFLRAKNESVVYNFCEDMQPVETPLSVTDNFGKPVLRLLSVGHLNSNKGIEESVLLAILLKDNNIDFKWKFIGSFQNPTFELKIRKMIETGGLKQNIMFESEISNDLILAEYAQADYLIFLSNGPEGQPVVLIEAFMVAKAVIIAKNISGIGEYVRNGFNGFLVNNYREVLPLLIIQDDIKLQTIKSNARKTYQDFFSVRSFSQKVKTIFEKPFAEVGDKIEQ